MAKCEYVQQREAMTTNRPTYHGQTNYSQPANKPTNQPTNQQQRTNERTNERRLFFFFLLLQKPTIIMEPLLFTRRFILNLYSTPVCTNNNQCSNCHFASFHFFGLEYRETLLSSFLTGVQRRKERAVSRLTGFKYRKKGRMCPIHVA